MIAYRLTYDGRTVHDLGLNVAILSGEYHLEAGTAGTLKFTIDPTHPLAKEDWAIKNASHEVVLEAATTQNFATIRGTERGELLRELFRGRITDVEGDASAYQTITCEGQLSYLGDTIVRPYATTQTDDLPAGTRIIAGPVADYLIKEHNEHCGPDKSFSMGECTFEALDAEGTDNPTTLDELKAVYCEGKDRYLRARTGAYGERFLDVLDGGVGVGTQYIVFGENLLDFASSTSWPDIATAIIATGQKDRETAAEDDKKATSYEEGSTEVTLEGLSDAVYYVNDVPITIQGDRAIGNELAAKYGYFEVARSYPASTPNELLQCVGADLDPRSANVRELSTLDVTAFDLSVENPDLAPIELLEWCRVYAPPYGVNQWMPCSKIDGDICDPAKTAYHFGDLPATLTRQSALRMGMVQRLTGSLIRKANGQARDSDLLHRETNRNSERIDDAVDKAEQDLQTATDTWGSQLDDATKAWYDSLDEAKKEDAQGREELLKNIQSLGDAMDGVEELAWAAQRVFWGVCDTRETVAAKEVRSTYLTRPGGQAFQLVEGATIDVKFQYPNEASSPTLNIAGTGARRIMTQGNPEFFCYKDQVVRFVYDGTYWQVMQAIFGTTAVIGNPAQANWFTDGTTAGLRIGDTYIIRQDYRGMQVGLDTKSHVMVTNSAVNFEGGWDTLSLAAGENSGPKLTTSGYFSMTAGSKQYIESTLHLGGGVYGYELDTQYDASVRAKGPQGVILGDHISTQYNNNRAKVIVRSLVPTVSGKEATFTPSQFGLTSFDRYTFLVCNGDYGTRQFTCACQVSPSTLHVTFDRELPSGLVRLNFLGFYCHEQGNYSEPGLPGPEIGDPGGEEPSEIGDTDA